MTQVRAHEPPQPLQPLDLWSQRQRPGEFCRPLPLRPGSTATGIAEAAAAAAGLPIELWVTIAIEASRCVDVLVQCGFERQAAVCLLDEQAKNLSNNSKSTCRTRLAAYADALVEAQPRSIANRVGALEAKPSLQMLTAWSMAAESTAQCIEDWASARIQGPTRAVAWEAAAAAAGTSLGEWTLYAALRASSAADHR